MTLFTRKEIESRYRKDNAAIIIDNVVYGVSAFLDDHPGGVEVLLANAGRDASRCFHDIGHSDDALEWRRSFRIGEVVDEDRWEVITRTESVVQTSDEWSLRGLVDVCGPPVCFTALAVLLYWYFLS